MTLTKTPRLHQGVLIEVAQEHNASNQYDELWAVYDKDGYTKHKEATETAEKLNVNIAFSSIAFEHWILLHFERSLTPFPKSKEVIEYFKPYLPNYEKNTEYTKYFLFEDTKDHLHTASKNAAWLRHQHRTHLQQKKPLYDLNPYTDIDRLVQYLLDIKERYQFADLNEVVTLNSLDICVQQDGDHVQIGLYNKGKSSLKQDKVVVTAFNGEAVLPIELEWSDKLILPKEPTTAEFEAPTLTHLEIEHEQFQLTILPQRENHALD